uniref:NRAMP family divalent metal transporter n=1 Tax=Thaumasiovibrio occultus TaxID=1891184 RepID=UPI000B34FD29|nr:divalent metal cation transporter [Thaumasiovibrio occultus]
MDNTIASPSGSKLGRFIASLGPGIMMATAAVGGSHLVASTKAGAFFGWQLAALILLVNLLKYPFFRAGVQYTMGTGKSLVQGYATMGFGYLCVFTFLSVVSAFINTAALALFSASLLGLFLPFDLSMTQLALIVLGTCIAILLAGHYRALDSISKFIMAALIICTVSAVVIAASKGGAAPADFVGPSPWTLASIGFIVITMGWMPAPIEISCLTSLWLKSQKEKQDVTPESALVDFNVGYIATAVLAIVFLSLGALVLYGSDTEISKSGIKFSHQLVSMYSSNIGEWSRHLIAVIAFFCIFGSTITVVDGYARAIVESQRLLSKKDTQSPVWQTVWIFAISTGAIVIVHFFIDRVMALLDFAMIMAFVTTPVFALLNYLLVSKTDLPAALKSGAKLKALSIIGLVYLFGFLAVFVWWKFFLVTA